MKFDNTGCVENSKKRVDSHALVTKRFKVTRGLSNLISRLYFKQDSASALFSFSFILASTLFSFSVGNSTVSSWTEPESCNEQQDTDDSGEDEGGGSGAESQFLGLGR